MDSECQEKLECLKMAMDEAKSGLIAPEKVIERAEELYKFLKSK